MGDKALPPEPPAAEQGADPPQAPGSTPPVKTPGCSALCRPRAQPSPPPPLGESPVISARHWKHIEKPLQIQLTNFSS